jgi:hypothetical protein
MLDAGERQHELAAQEAVETVSTDQRSAAALTAVVSVLALALLLLFTACCSAPLGLSRAGREEDAPRPPSPTS